MAYQTMSSDFESVFKLKLDHLHRHLCGDKASCCPEQQLDDIIAACDVSMLSLRVDRLTEEVQKTVTRLGLADVRAVEGYHRFYSAPTVEVVNDKNDCLASVVVTEDKYIINGDEEVSY